MEAPFSLSRGSERLARPAGRKRAADFAGLLAWRQRKWRGLPIPVSRGSGARRWASSRGVRRGAMPPYSRAAARALHRLPVREVCGW